MLFSSSIHFAQSLAFFHINYAEIHAGHVAVQQRKNRFDESHRCRDEQHRPEQTYSRHYGSFGEMQKIQGSVERFISGAHEEENLSIRVINSHYRILRHVDEFVAGFSLKE